MFVYIPAGNHFADLRAVLRSVGLEALHDDGLSLEKSEVLANGPDGGAGFVIGWGAVGRLTAYRPDRQEWHRCAPCGELPGGRAWIGWDTSERPTPAILARSKQLPGEGVLLADGHEWLIPIATQLPRIMGLDPETGRVSSVVAPQYKPFLQDAWNTLASFMEKSGEVTIDHETGFAAAVRVLAMNYRVCRDLVAVLGIVADSHLWTIPATACEAAAMVDLLQKKSLSESPSIASGGPG
jgi:hypothetical protein